MSQIPDLSYYRRFFPSLDLDVESRKAIYFDNPGGTQVAQQVIDAMVMYFREANANTHGAFLTSKRTDQVIAEARSSMADFLHAASPNEIVFGPNMTTLTFAFSRAIGKTLQPDDEIVVTILDHDANVAPWIALQERGVIIRKVDVHPENVTLDMEDMRAKITNRTRIVAVGYASNAVGTINDIATIIRWAHDVGAVAWIDAVQFAPHGPIDVQELDADFLVCSSYKFFGPHLGILYGKAELLEKFPAYKVRPASNTIPDRWETGTQNHEGLAGLVGVIDYLAMIGRENSSQYHELFSTKEAGSYHDRQLELKVAMQALMDYERGLSAQLLTGLREIKGLKVYGVIDTLQLGLRVPTFACNLEGYSPRELARYLASQGIFVWDGNYYALGIMERLELESKGGALRIGLAHYNTIDEIDRLLECFEQLEQKS
jgi:cysteine desulfurase family protein (TIGR01976 family)